MQTQVEELADNRVRLTVAVPPADVEHAVEHAASDLAASVKIPGFRKGKVPRQVLLARVGRERLFTEAVESHIGGWFWNAAARSRIQPVEQPEFEYDVPTSENERFGFTATVAVQPKPQVADWTALEVPRADSEIPSELVDQHLEQLRHTVAELVPVEGRPAAAGDTVVVDLVHPSGEAQRDYVVALGTGALLDEIDAGIQGMSIGETRTIEYEIAAPAAETTQRASVDATLKELKEPSLPPLDDELARTVSEFDTLAELRSDVEAQLREQLEDEIEAAFRAAAIDALVDASHVEAAPALVDLRARELVQARARSLEQRGIALETYLAITNQTAEQFVEAAREEASRAVGRELVLDAVADQLAIEVADEDVERVVREQAEAAEQDPDETLERIRSAGRFERLRDDLRLREALDRIVAEVKPIPVELAQAREKLWTPDKEKPETPAKLWTPGSKEPA